VWQTLFGDAELADDQAERKKERSEQEDERERTEESGETGCQPRVSGATHEDGGRADRCLGFCRRAIGATGIACVISGPARRRDRQWRQRRFENFFTFDRRLRASGQKGREKRELAKWKDRNGLPGEGSLYPPVNPGNASDASENPR